MNVQARTRRCERCGATCPVTRDSPFEFLFSCPNGHGGGILSWSHQHEPPVFAEPEQPPQPSLFDEVPS